MIDGAAGNDTVRGGLGNDLLDGGEGIDLIDYSDAQAPVVFALSQVSTYVSSGPDTGGLGINQYKNFEGVIGSGGFADSIDGSNFDDILIGGSGNDLLAGGAGRDQSSYLASNQGIDLIVDFVRGASGDQISLRRGGFGNIGNAGVFTSGNFATRTSFATIDGSTSLFPLDLTTDNNKAIRITNAQTTAQILTGSPNGSTGVNAIVLVFNSDAGRGEMWYDNNWQNPADRAQLVTFDNITSVGALNTFTQDNFFGF